MGVNEGTHPDSDSQCKNCLEWFFDGDLIRCDECEELHCEGCHQDRTSRLCPQCIEERE